MSRKKTQPKKNVVPDPKFKSTIIPKLINNIMYDGKRGIAAKIVYDAIDKIKTKTKDEPINIFNEAINNIKPTVEVRSRSNFYSWFNVINCFIKNIYWFIFRFCFNFIDSVINYFSSNTSFTIVHDVVD